MKIATNTSISPIGGIVRRVKEIKRRVNENSGRDQLVIIEITASERSVVEEIHTKTYKIPLPDSVELNTIYKGLRSLHNLRQRFEPTIKEIETVLDRENVEVVLSEGTYYAPWLLYSAARRAGLPLVILYAGVLKYETTHFPDDVREMMIEMERDFIDPDFMFLFPSDLTRHSVEKEYGYLNRLEIVPNGISKEFFQLEPKNNSDGIGFVGRLTKIKNPEYLLFLRNELKSKKKKINLNMVSDIDPKNRLRKRLSRAGIRLFPVMTTQRLREFYRDMGIIISPSYFETYGNVPVESVAAGTPALINRNMGVAEVFKKHDLHNLIVDFEDVQAVVSQIEEFRVQKVHKDIRESLKKYRWDAVIDTYFNVCRQEIER